MQALQSLGKTIIIGGGRSISEFLHINNYKCLFFTVLSTLAQQLRFHLLWTSVFWITRYTLVNCHCLVCSASRQVHLKATYAIQSFFYTAKTRYNNNLSSVTDQEALLNQLHCDLAIGYISSVITTVSMWNVQIPQSPDVIQFRGSKHRLSCTGGGAEP